MDWVIGGLVAIVIASIGSTTLQSKARHFADALTRRPQENSSASVVVPIGRNARKTGNGIRQA